MRTDGHMVYVNDDDAATLRQIADEFGIDVVTAKRRLELTSDHHDPDELLRPAVAACYRLVLDSEAAAIELRAMRS